MKVYRAQRSGEAVFFHVEGPCEPPREHGKQRNSYSTDPLGSLTGGLIRSGADSVPGKISRDA